MSLDVAVWADSNDNLPAEIVADYDATPPICDDQPDLIITLGDLLAPTVRRVAAAFPAVPLLGVYGNHCTRGYLEQIPSATNLAGKYIAAGWELAGLTVLGVEGCVRYKSGTHDVLWTQEEYAARLDSITAPVDVLITHCPPAGCNDHTDAAHVGIDALARLIERCGVTLVLHGHTYPDAPAPTFRGARVHYVHGWQRISLPLPHPRSW